MKEIEALGVIETQYFTYALELLDEMVKTANVQYLSSEKYLGGRLVTVIVGGGISDVNTAVQAAKEKALRENRPLKMAITITNPHDEILKFIVSKEKRKPKPAASGKMTNSPKQNKRKKATKNAAIKQSE